MRITYTSKHYAPENVTARYVQNVGGVYRFCECNAKRWDIRQGEVEPSEIPAAVRAAADTQAGYFPSYVVWPL
jgi:hypothetical protein